MPYISDRHKRGIDCGSSITHKTCMLLQVKKRNKNAHTMQVLWLFPDLRE